MSDDSSAEVRKPVAADDEAKAYRELERQKKAIAAMVRTAGRLSPLLARIRPLRRRVLGGLERRVREDTEKEIRTGMLPPRVCQDRLALAIALLRTLERAGARGRFSAHTLGRILDTLVTGTIVHKGDLGAKEAFRSRFGVHPPGFLLISPTKFCNLRCEGCYADSRAVDQKLSYATLDRMVTEAHDLWGSRFITISGGEPLTYRDGGHDILDLAAAHPDMFFLMYTNGTLVDDRTAKRIARLGNLTPAVSVEGLRERTDRRRGKGAFEKIVAAMERLRREKVLFGVSITASRENADEILSDPVMDFYMERMEALYAWVFHYMPMGRGFMTSLMPTAEQRLALWHRFWHLINDRGYFIADFWNGGTISKGCLSAGRTGGYMVVDWNGAAMPCVFMPYSPVNIGQAYAEGKTLNDVWAHPFFARVRGWQAEMGYDRPYSDGTGRGNWLRPCPIRDHYREFHRWLQTFAPAPEDENAAAAAEDPEYHERMCKYDDELAALFDPIWEREYLAAGSGAPGKAPKASEP